MKHATFGRPTAAILDDPVRAACDSGWRQWVQSYGAARALPASIGHFAALGEENPNSGQHLAALISRRKAPVLLLQKAKITVPAPVKCLEEFGALQMVLSEPPALPDMDEINLLETRDAEDMLALAQISKPGPFSIGTPLLGKFLGIRQDGKLIAMAGQRMKLPGYIEVSGVCVHPDFQGRGLGADLTCAMVHLILSGSAMPFLHTYRDNHRAISLYERLGFEVRTKMHLVSAGLSTEQA